MCENNTIRIQDCVVNTIPNEVKIPKYVQYILPISEETKK